MRQEIIKFDMLAKKTNAIRQKEYKRLQQAVEQCTRRISEIDRLIEKIFEQSAKQKVTDLRLLLHTLHEMTDIMELTPTLVNSLIDRIEVHNNDKSTDCYYVKVNIYFTSAVMIDILPNRKSLL